MWCVVCRLRSLLEFKMWLLFIFIDCQQVVTLPVLLLIWLVIHL